MIDRRTELLWPIQRDVPRRFTRGRPNLTPAPLSVKIGGCPKVFSGAGYENAAGPLFLLPVAIMIRPGNADFEPDEEKLV